MLSTARCLLRFKPGKVTLSLLAVKQCGALSRKDLSASSRSDWNCFHFVLYIKAEIMPQCISLADHEDLKEFMFHQYLEGVTLYLQVPN